ncbi:MAG: ABC transporter permease [Gemmatimonadaceae bacterium]
MRTAHGLGWLEMFRQDVSYALRQLRQNPAFATATILTLALGIGASTTVATIFRTVSRPGMPFESPERLVYVRQQEPKCTECSGMASGNYLTIRNEARSLSSVSLVGHWPYIHRGADRSDLLTGGRVSSDFFRTLGIPPLLGRTIVPADSQPGRDRVVVLSEATWRSRFDADSGVIGRPMILDGESYTIVGVIAAAHEYPRATELWTPLVLDARLGAERRWPNYAVVGRLRDGVAFETAHAELWALGMRTAAVHSDAMPDQTFGAVPFLTWHDPGIGDEARIFLTAVGFVLLIACINLAGLFLARLVGRRRELAVRSALGASGTRVAAQLVVETVVLSLIGGAGGAVIAAVALRLVRNALSPEMIASKPQLAHLAPDAGMLVMALALGVLTGIVIGLWPAIRLARPDLVSELGDASRGATAASGSARLRQALVAAQVAFAIVLLCAAVLLTRSARRMYATHPGFDARQVLAFRLHDAINSRRSFGDPERQDRLVAELEALPGVERAAAALRLPYDDNRSVYDQVERRLPSRSADSFRVPRQVVTTGYFDVLGIPVVRGRAFNATDRAGSPRVAIVNQAAADALFPGENPIGQELMIGKVAHVVIGVSGNVMYGRVSAGASLEVLRLMRQLPGGVTAGIVLRTRADPADVAASVRRVVRAFDPDLAITRMQPLTERENGALAPIRLNVGMMTFFALSAIAISAIGLFGVIGHAVALRTREFGIRLALGATSGSVSRLVLRQGMQLTAVGAALGVFGALLATRLMRTLLYQVSPADPVTYGLVVLSVGLVALIASYVPARTASRVNASAALRHD